MKILFLSFLTLTSVTASTVFAAVTEQDYLGQNKIYTDAMLALLNNQPQYDKSTFALKTQKTTVAANLKKATSTLTQTNNSIASNQAKLSKYQTTLANKDDIQQALLSEKINNTDKINALNPQINSQEAVLANKMAQLQNLQFAVDNLQSEINTQIQIKNVTVDKINSLNWEISSLQQQQQQRANQISQLRAANDVLRAQKEAATDPAEKQALQLKIEANRAIAQGLIAENELSNKQEITKKLEVIQQQSELSQSNTKLTTLNIEMNNKQNQLANQNTAVNETRNALANLKDRKSSLLTRNQDIVDELNALKQLPQLIADITALISAQQLQIVPQQATVDKLTVDLATVSTALSQLETQIKAETDNVVSLEQTNDAVLEELFNSIPH